MKDKQTLEVAHQRGTRLSKPHADELINLFGGAHAQSEYFRADDLLLINYAHVIMLYEQSIINLDEATEILLAIKSLEEAGVEETIHLDSRVGDLSTHVEAYIIQATSVETGGKIHTGRSRNDLYPTMTKMLTRRSVLDVYGALVSLNETLLLLAEKYSDTIMPGYTQHSQHAQPITLGFYLLGNYDVFGRSLQRLEDFWKRLNLCPMGAAALATTSFPLDRKRIAELIGFDDFQEHAYDAISSRDFLLEYLFILSAIASDIGRITENLIYWNTYEFGMIVLADEFTSFSTIMPQKKNPVALETLRSLNPVITGKLHNAFGILKALPWSNGRENTILDDDSIETGTQLKNMLLLLKGILESMTIKQDRMYDLALRGFSVSTDLADLMVKEYDYSFRTAHEIVGFIVKNAVDANLDPTKITSGMVEAAVKEFLGEEISVDAAKIRQVVDPKESVEVRNLPGGPAHKEVIRMKEKREIMLETNKEFLVSCSSRIENAHKTLYGRVKDIVER